MQKPYDCQASMLLLFLIVCPNHGLVFLLVYCSLCDGEELGIALCVEQKHFAGGYITYPMWLWVVATVCVCDFLW